MAAKKAVGKPASTSKLTERKKAPVSIAAKVLIEAGYRCAVPTCRNTLAMDLHHLWQFSKGGGDTISNLIALCPYCHGLHHRGTIPAEALYVYKSLLISLGQAFDVVGIDHLLFLHMSEKKSLIVSGDGVLAFARLISSGLAQYVLEANNNGQLVTYSISLTDKGKLLVDAWLSGNRTRVGLALSSGWAHLKGTSPEDQE